jgi:hypothetical protein
VRSRRLYTACLGIHLALLVAVSGRELLWFIAHGPTIFPSASSQFWEHSNQALSNAVQGKSLTAVAARQSVKTYLHLAGAEVGYGFFAPNVPDSYRLVFELHYPDGRVESVLPTVRSHAAGLRLAGMLDKIGRNPEEKIREIMIGLFAYSIWREHPTAISIRAIFASVTLPSATEYEQGARKSHQVIAAYDFDFHENPGEQERQ